MSSKERCFRAVAVASGVLAGLLIGELGLRLQVAVSGRSVADADVRRSRTIVPPAYEGSCEGKLGASLAALLWPSPQLDMVYELKPGLDTCFVRARVQTSQDGLRTGAKGLRPTSRAAFRILLLGDSQAFGWGVTYEETTGALLERELTAQGRSVEVLNAGVPGYNAAQEAAYLATLGPAFKPDCVLVLFTGNDFDPPIFRANSEPPRPPLSYVAATVRRAWRRWRSPAAVEGQPLEALTFAPSAPDLAEVPPEYRSMVGVPGYKNALASMSRSGNRLHAPIVNFADYSYLLPEEQSRDLLDYQRSLGIIHPDFNFPLGGRFHLRDDDPHLNAQGHRALSQRVAAGLRSANVCGH